MKNFTFILILGAIFLYSCKKEIPPCSCKKEEPPIIEESVTACGIEDPAKNIPWLAELIATAEKDTTANYLGTIWLAEYEEQDYIVVNMTLGTIYSFHAYDCEGNLQKFSNYLYRYEFRRNIKEKKLLYCKPIHACGVTDPAHELPWLAELIKRANRGGSWSLYYGEIWLENFKGNDIFFTSMHLSAGCLYQCFDCLGNHIHWYEMDTFFYKTCPVCDYIGCQSIELDDEDFEEFWICPTKKICIYSRF